VPLGRRTVTGYILGITDRSDYPLKEALDILDREPLLTAPELEFLRWTADYYLFPFGEVLKAALPRGINIVGKTRIVLDEQGVPVEREVLTGGRSVHSENFCIAQPDAEEPARLSDKMRQLLTAIRAAGEISAGALRRTFGPCSTQIKRLEELGQISIQQREVYRDPFHQEVLQHDSPLTLNPDQAAAVHRLGEALAAGIFSPFLLHGVTGSGKTEVYLQAIARVLAAEKTALVLVPEIALTPQLVTRFRRRFSCGIAVLHSGLSDGERYDEWRRIRRGEVSIVIGARSAIFAPLQRIGIVVVDEEHDGSYKQGEGLRYNARDLALVRGKQEEAIVLLGSATPLVTSWHAAHEGKLGYLRIPGRVRNLPMPAIELLDAQGHKGETFLPPLKAALAETLAQGGQSLLFLNRRGFATWLVCDACGHVLRCPNCAVTLTFHRSRRRHGCHYCGYSIPAPSVCPDCGGLDIGLLGRGTERVEDEVKELLPEARVARMDRDTTAGRGGHARILRGIENGTIDILVGTQMIAKGHDFPGVTLVGVISADATLNLPDFRSAERTFQLLSQVSGRAGRGDQPGRVLIQTFDPGHYAVACAAEHDYERFCTEELEFRRELGYPPFAHLALIVVSGTAARTVETAAAEAAQLLREIRQNTGRRVEVLGPAVAPLSMVRGRHRWQILLKATVRNDLRATLHAFRHRSRPPAQARIIIDIDPVDML
jgi:primosomal protein N' (replication factor Y)